MAGSGLAYRPPSYSCRPAANGTRPTASIPARTRGAGLVIQSVSATANGRKSWNVVLVSWGGWRHAALMPKGPRTGLTGHGKAGTGTARVAMLAYPDIQMLDVVGPLGVFSRTSRWPVGQREAGQRRLQPGDPGAEARQVPCIVGTTALRRSQLRRSRARDRHADDRGRKGRGALPHPPAAPALDPAAGGLGQETRVGPHGGGPRNFARVFTREVGATPARFVTSVRVETARRLPRSRRRISRRSAP